jgi:hypothetical protein
VKQPTCLAVENSFGGTLTAQTLYLRGLSAIGT